MATNWSETNTWYAKRTKDGVGGSQPVNVNTLTMILLYGINGQSGRVISVTILTSYFACVFWIYFTLPLVAKKTSISAVFCCCCCLCSYFESYKKINLILSFVISWSYFFCNKNFVRSILSLTFSSKKLTVECYQSLIRLKKFSKPTRTSMASSGLSVKRRVTRSVAQRSELVAIMGCGVDLQHLVTVSRKYI